VPRKTSNPLSRKGFLCRRHGHPPVHAHQYQPLCQGRQRRRDHRPVQPCRCPGQCGQFSEKAWLETRNRQKKKQKVVYHYNHSDDYVDTILKISDLVGGLMIMDLKTIGTVLVLTVPFFFLTVWAIVDCLHKDFGTIGKKSPLGNYRGHPFHRRHHLFRLSVTEKAKRQILINCFETLNLRHYLFDKHNCLLYSFRVNILKQGPIV
jgi:hypothetical protein